MGNHNDQKPIRVDEDSRLNLSVTLLKGVLAAVAAGAFWTAGVFFLALSIKDDMREVKRTIQDHERRLIKIEAKTGVAKFQQSANGLGEQ